MKNILTFAAFALTSFMLFTGCKKGGTTTGYTMAASLGGSVTLFDNSVVSVANNSVTGAKTYIIEGLKNAANYPYIYIYLPKADTGTYTIGTASMPTHAIYATDAATTRQSVSGTVHISEVSSTMVGTFSFTCADGTAITAGTFTAKMF